MSNPLISTRFTKKYNVKYPFASAGIGFFGLPDLAIAVTPTLVLASVGIVTGKQVAAALCLGADGVWAGTRQLENELTEREPIFEKTAYFRKEHTEVNLEWMPLLAGQAVSAINDIKPAGEIIHRMMAEAAVTLVSVVTF